MQRQEFSSCKKKRLNKEQNLNVLIYPPKPEGFPRQTGPVCYFYSIMRMLQYHLDDYKTAIPAHCQNIITDIISLCDLESNFAEKVDKSFRKYLTKDKVAVFMPPAEPINPSPGQESDHNDCEKESEEENEKESEKESEEEEHDLIVDDFMSEYSHTEAMALLLGACFKFRDSAPMTIGALYNYLKHYGPCVFDGCFECGAEYSALPSRALTGTLTVQSLQDDQLENNSHAILVIGCEKYPNNKVFYIDPNYPACIFEMPFSSFKERVYLNPDGIISYPKMELIPVIIKDAAHTDRLRLFTAGTTKKGKYNESACAYHHSNY